MLQLITADLQNIIMRYALVNILVAAGLTFVLVCIRKQEREVWLRRLFLFGYLVFVIELTLLTREPGSRSTVDLSIFGTFHDNDYAMSFVYENVLLMLPFGILLPWNIRWFHKFLRCSLAGLFLSLGIEVAQLITKRGYFQVDDIWLNVVGTISGWCGYYLLHRIVVTGRGYIRKGV